MVTRRTFLKAGALWLPSTSLAAQSVLPQRRKAFRGGGAATDPYFSSVVLLAHMNGSGSTFVDSSSYARTITAYGDATQSATQFKFGGKSGYFDRSGDYLSVADAAALEIGTGDFTIESWIYLDQYSVNHSGYYDAVIYGRDNYPGRCFSFWVSGTSSSWTGLDCNIFPTEGAPTSTTGAYAFSLNTWYFVACRRIGSTVSLWVDGVQVGTGTNTANAQDLSTPWTIGAITYVGYTFFFPGYIDDLRVTIGVGRTITVPTAQFPDA